MGSNRKGRVIRRSLTKKGFAEEMTDHVVFVFSYDGRATSVSTHMSHGADGDDIGASLIGKMARQLFLSKKEFLDLIDCPMSEEDLREMLIREGHVVPTVRQAASGSEAAE